MFMNHHITFGLSILAATLLFDGHASAQVVGCDALGCTSGCQIGNTTNDFIGTTSFNTSVSPHEEFTWTVGSTFTEAQNLTAVNTWTKNYYLGSPPSLNLANTSAFEACALFFEGNSIDLDTTGQNTTCDRALNATCVKDLLSQAKQQMQKIISSSKDGTVSALCLALQSALQSNAPQSCTLAAHGSWGTIVPRPITGSNATLTPLQQPSCHPSTGGADYNIALIESQSLSEQIPYASVVLPFTQGTTPILTVIFPAANESSTLSAPETHLSCVTVIEQIDENLPGESSSGSSSLSQGLGSHMFWVYVVSLMGAIHMFF